MTSLAKIRAKDMEVGGNIFSVSVRIIQTNEIVISVMLICKTRRDRFCY